MFFCSTYALMFFVECFRKHDTSCQFVTKRGSCLLGEMILFPKLPKGEFVSLKYWLMFVSKMKRKEPSVRTGFIAVRT
jgi:hypothetical protein